MFKVAVGIDIGGTNTVMGVVDEKGNVLSQSTILTPSHGDITKFTEDIGVSVLQLEESIKTSYPEAEFVGIGIGAPNANYYTGNIEQAPNLSFKGVVPFVKLLAARLPDFKTVVITNDANAAAIGEMIYGGARGMRNFIMFTLGTGVGSGIVVNGDLVYGHDGFAGECGHITIIHDGRLCGCGLKGHLEAYCSAPGMKRTALELLARYNATDSLLADMSLLDISSKGIFEAAEKGDKIAKEVFELTAKWLGMGLAIAAHHLSPEAIFLFGGPTAAGDYLFKPAKESMEAALLPTFKNKIKLLPSQLKAGTAAIVGASALVYKELEK